MSTIVYPIGISGSGKSLLGDNLKKKIPDLNIICMDDFRRDLTGSVSDQTQNEKVWKKSQAAMNDALSRGEDVFYSATNLTSKKGFVTAVAELLEQHRRKGLRAIVAFLIDSKDPKMCLKRVEKDLSDGVDRSVVGDDIVNRQYQRFMAMYDTPWIQERSLLGIDVMDVVATSERDVAQLAEKIRKNQGRK